MFCVFASLFLRGLGAFSSIQCYPILCVTYNQTKKLLPTSQILFTPGRVKNKIKGSDLVITVLYQTIVIILFQHWYNVTLLYGFMNVVYFSSPLNRTRPLTVGEVMAVKGGCDGRETQANGWDAIGILF